MSGRQTIQRAVALLLRLTAVVFLLAIALGIAGAYAIGLTRPYVQIFGQNVVGERSAYYTIQENELILSCSRGWSGGHAKPGALCSAPGLRIERTIVTLTGQARGDEQLTIRVRWWLLAMACALALLAGFVLFRPLLRRRFSGPGRCPNCGYDLHATPERCPECGLRQAQSSQTARVAESRYDSVCEMKDESALKLEYRAERPRATSKLALMALVCAFTPFVLNWVIAIVFGPIRIESPYIPLSRKLIGFCIYTAFPTLALLLGGIAIHRMRAPRRHGKRMLMAIIAILVGAVMDAVVLCIFVEGLR